MTHFLVSYINSVSPNGLREMREIAGKSFTPGGMPCSLGPYSSEQSATEIMDRLCKVGRWPPGDAILLEGQAGASLDVLIGFSQIQQHPSWLRFTSEWEVDAILASRVEVAEHPRCLAFLTTHPEGGYPPGMGFLVDKEVKTVFSRRWIDIHEYVSASKIAECAFALNDGVIELLLS